MSWRPTAKTCNEVDEYGDAQAGLKKEDIKVSGAGGMKRTYILAVDSPFAPPKGTFVASFCFNREGFDYIARYTQLSSYPDVQDEFNMMVMQTFEFGGRQGNLSKF